jgi:hypothetical protein
VAAKAARAADAAASTVSPEREAVARQRWGELAQEIRQLDSSDQDGLDRLYAGARDLIRSDEAAAGAALRHSMGALTRASLEESFFAISAWIRSSQAPEQVIEALWESRPPGDDGATADPHHVAMTPAVRYERMQAYALRELRRQLDQGNAQLSGEGQASFVSALVPRATSEHSLDVSLEMFQLLAKLKQPQAIQTALGGHSVRDQQLILGVIAANP